MLAAYIADPLIGVIADFYMPESKDRQWQKERMEAFEEACDLAIQKGAELILLAGKLFAEEYVPAAVISQVLDIIRGRKAVFVWKPDRMGKQYLKSRADIPPNFFLLNGDETRSCLFREANITAWYETEKGDGDANVLIFDPGREPTPEILERTRGQFPGAVFLSAGETVFVREGKQFRGEETGKLENTGFDDPDSSGFILFALEEGTIKFWEKIKTARYHFRTVSVKVEREDDHAAVYRKCAKATAEFTKHDFVRIILNGSVDAEAFVRTDTLQESLQARFFYLEVFNDCRLELDEEAYANDISLKSEMIRMVLAEDSLSESEKSRIIQCGWNALRGKELPE